MNDHIQSYLHQHEQYLLNLVNEKEIAAPSIGQAMRYSLLVGGKRLRPLLIYLSGEVFELQTSISDALAASVEMMHCYSLIHDDLPAMDDDDFRRGRPSCHRQFDEATAILVGDALANWSVDLLLERLERWLDSKLVLQIARCLLKATGAQGMISGQSLDLQWLSQPNVDEERVRIIHRLKTGCLISACIDMVLIASGEKHTEQGLMLQKYAQDLGLAFQMQDDYLDKFSDPQLIGKNRSSDSNNAKFTYADLLGERALKFEVQRLYLAAQSRLEICGEKAQPLKQLTQQLALRS